jgi:ABC-type phosphate transport system substrate-binding protein
VKTGKLIRATIAFLLLFTSAYAVEMSPIVNPDSSITSLTVTEIRMLYLYRNNRLPNGQKAVVYKLPDTNRLHQYFLRDVLGMTPYQFKREVNKKTDSDNYPEVREVGTIQDMINRVASTPNAIGYIDSDSLIINNGINEIKVLHIDY